MPHPRNRARHALLFAVLNPAFHHWPEQEDFQPQDTEHLRSWLLVEAGHCEVDDIKFAGGSKAQMVGALTAFMNRQRGKTWIHYRQTADGIRALTPKSIAFRKCSEDAFKKVLERAIEIIELKTGVIIEDLKREHGRAA